ncbi:hypothetical protein M9Y10_001993 [Tritrichomonas musculus]|uniref:Uncharacterized protein n=1 Tax=Tritrichomonas musculus TaxID=1915356 RepID=A0ABR2L9H7_9EUKA
MDDDEISGNSQTNLTPSLHLASPLETLQNSEDDQMIESVDFHFGHISDPSMLLYNCLKKNMSETELKCSVFHKAQQNPSLPYIFTNSDNK